MTLNCKSCGKKLSNDAKFCTECGERIIREPTPTRAQFCGNCGSSLTASAKFCMKCGIPIAKLEQQSIPHELSPEPHVCTDCGTKLRPNDRFCDECGMPVKKPITAAAPKMALVDLTGQCFLCGLPTPPKIILCPRCGVRQNCFRCGMPLGPGKTPIHSFCPQCGHRKISKKLQERIGHFRSLPPLTADQILDYYQ
ncbi:MAG: zinc ribbon domain-containing protein [Candidatus Hodarchaeota archaeon]